MLSRNLVALVLFILITGLAPLAAAPSPGNQPGPPSDPAAPPPVVWQNPLDTLRTRLDATALEDSRRYLDDALRSLAAGALTGDDKARSSVEGHLLGGVTPYKQHYLTRDGLAVVDLTVAPGPDESPEDALERARKRLEPLDGIEVRAQASTPAFGMLTLDVAPGALLELAAQRIGPAQASAAAVGAADKQPDPVRMNQGSANNQAIIALDIEDALRVYPGLDGDGIGVGTLSDSVDQVDGVGGDGGLIGIAESRNSGDLPEDTIFVIEDYTDADATDEGRAMMEHIHDIAPSLDQLNFATAFGGQAQFAANIAWLAISGMEIINDDVVYYGEPYFQDGVIAQSVNSYVDNGGIYFALNHNYGNLSYQSVWTSTDGDNYHDFVPSDNSDEIQRFTIDSGATIRIGLQWTQPMGQAQTDLNIELWNSDVSASVASTATNNVGGDPGEILLYTNSTGFEQTLSLAIKYIPHDGDTPPDGLTLKYIYFDNGTSNIEILEHAEGASGTLTPHAGTPKAIAIGAAPFYSRSNPEDFSGHGPFQQFFDAAGNDIAPVVLEKPDFLSIDACNNTFFGRDVPEDADVLPNFFGTSAATPNAAAVAALMLEAAGGPGQLDQEDVREILKASAIELGAAGHDTIYGYGRINALGAILAAKGPTPSASIDWPIYLNQYGDYSVAYSHYAESRLDLLIAPQGSFTYTSRASGRDLGIDFVQVLHYQDTGELVGVDYGSTGGGESRIDTFPRQYAPMSLQIAAEQDYDGREILEIEIDGPTPLTQFINLGDQLTTAIQDNLFINTDMDYYPFTVPARADGDFTATLHPEFDGVLLLYDNLGNLLRMGDSIGAGSPDTLTWPDLEPGDALCIAVASWQFKGSGTFTLMLEFDAPVAEAGENWTLY